MSTRLNLSNEEVHIIATALQNQADMYTECADDEHSTPEFRTECANLSHLSERAFQRFSAISLGLRAEEAFDNDDLPRGIEMFRYMLKALEEYSNLTA